MASRDLKDAHKELRDAFDTLSYRFSAWFPGWNLIVVTTYRSPEEQAVEFRAGRSRLDGTVKKSHHNVKPSNALDVMIVAPGGQLLDSLYANGKVSREQMFSMYGLFGVWAQRLGLRWGGDWDSDGLHVVPDPDESLNDPYHIELRRNV